MNKSYPQIVFITSGHKPFNSRIYNKEIGSLKKKYKKLYIIAPYHKKKETIDNVHILGIKKYKSRYNRFGILKSLYSIAIKLKPHVLHCHEPDSLLISYLVKKRLKNVKVIYDCHEFHPESFTENLPLILRLFLRSFIEKFENSLVKKIDCVITVNQKLVDRFSRHNNFVTLLPNYPRVALFQSIKRQKSILSSNHVTLIYIGSLSTDRGIFTMLEVIQKLNQSLNSELVLIGKFSSSETEQLFYNKLKNDSIEAKVNYKGYLPYEETIKILFQADIGLFLQADKKRYYWGEPIKYFEYSAAGLPIIMSDLPAKRMLIKKNKNGLVVPTNNLNEAVRAINYITSHRDEAIKMGENGTRAFFDHYNWERIENRLLDTYKSVLK